MEFEEVVKKRTATRKFSDKKVSAEDLKKILEIGRLAPTAKNVQPQKIFVLQSPEALEKLDTVTPCRYNAPVCLLVCADKNLAFTNGDYSSYEMDASIVATHMILEATNLKIDNIWVRHFDAENVKKVFSLPENIQPICLIPLGYADKSYTGNPLHTQRKPLSETVEFI